MHRHLFRLTILSMGLLLAAPSAFAQSPAAKPDRGERMARVLDLAPDQATALSQLREQHQANTASVRDALRTKRGELRAAWQTPDRAQLLRLTDEIAHLDATLKRARVDFIFSAQGVLTPEQFERFTRMQQRMGQRGHFGPRGGMKGHHGKRGERGVRGDRGERGERGVRGDRGPRGERGVRGQGPRGERGVRGQGPRGE